MPQRKPRGPRPGARVTIRKKAVRVSDNPPASGLRPELVGIGIDLLSLNRAHDLLRRHGRSFLDRILASSEKIQKPVCSALQLARYFTAKEAFFKASGLPWNDVKGFSGMWIEKIRGKKFEMGCVDSGLKGSGEFFKRGDIWGAKVITWNSFILPLNRRFNRRRSASRSFKVRIEK